MTTKDQNSNGSDSMTGKTHSWEGRTVTGGATPPWLSRSALAARSIHAVDRIKDPEERRKAFFAHMEQYPPTIGQL
jgi:hypothetical protein